MQVSIEVIGNLPNGASIMCFCIREIPTKVPNFTLFSVIGDFF
jgi:hypothetical protein